jgi:hypothetical protein
MVRDWRHLQQGSGESRVNGPGVGAAQMVVSGGGEAPRAARRPPHREWCPARPTTAPLLSSNLIPPLPSLPLNPALVILYPQRRQRPPSLQDPWARGCGSRSSSAAAGPLGATTTTISGRPGCSIWPLLPDVGGTAPRDACGSPPPVPLLRRPSFSFSLPRQGADELQFRGLRATSASG